MRPPLACVLGAAAVLAACAHAPAASELGVGPQYDTTHVYVDRNEVDAFVASFLATFGGTSTAQVVATVTPTPSSTTAQLLRTPVGSVSLFGFQTPVPYPFGAERTGYLVRDLDEAVAAARAAGADVLVEPFRDAAGRDAIIQWPGGVTMQLYWHAIPPSYAALATIPENRVYVSAARADAFVTSFVGFARGTVVSDDPRAPAIEIGHPGATYRRIRISSRFGKLAVLVSDGHLAYPYGRELTGYEVRDLETTLAAARTTGARVLVEPFDSGDRRSAMLELPGGYVAEVHEARGSEVDTAPSAARPAAQLNRAAEDWSVLARPSLRTEPLDSLKYIRLWGGDPKRYLSLGLTLRERAESTDAPLFGVKGHGEDAYDLHRLQLHADLHLDASLNAFVQLEDVRAFGKAVIGPADANPVDLRQAFVMFQHALGPGTFKLRAGRQELSFDLQRFISLRDGPNVQQAFDAVWAAWDAAPWKVLGLASLPVEYAHAHWFDDTSSFEDRLGLVRLERKLGAGIAASLYYGRYDRPRVTYGDAVGAEKRDLLDVRFVGARGSLDWDAEAMVQGGRVGAKRIRAWATGVRAGYAIHPPLATRLGLQVDTASGDKRAGDGAIETFTPLFPNGYYFTLASDTGYANLVHVKPSVTQKLTRDVVAMAAIGLQWRETTADAVYLHPMTPLPGTAGAPGAWTGGYAQLRSEAKFGPSVAVAAELVHFQAGDAIRAAGGGNSDYAGLETKLAW